MADEQELDDLEILEEMKKRLFIAFKQNKEQLKVGDLLKVIEMKRKLAVDGKGEKKFWEMINKLRQEELAGSKKSGRAKKSKRS